MENLVFTQLSVQEVRKMLREEVQSALKEFHPESTSEEERCELMTIEELSKFINITVPSVYGLTHRKQIPYIKRGKRLIFEKKQIIDWLLTGRQKTMKEIQADANAYLRSHAKYTR